MTMGPPPDFHGPAGRYLLEIVQGTAPCTPADVGVLDDVVVCHSGCCSLTALDRFKEDTTEWRSTNPYKPGGSKYDEIEGRLLDLYRSGLSWAQKRSSNQQRSRPKLDEQHSAVDRVTSKSRIARSVVALLIYWSASAMTACHDRGGPTVVGHTPTPTIDSLIVSVEDVRRFAGFPTSSRIPKATSVSPIMPTPIPPARARLFPTSERLSVALGPSSAGVLQFTAKSNAGVRQNVGHGQSGSEYLSRRGDRPQCVRQARTPIRGVFGDAREVLRFHSNAAGSVDHNALLHRSF